MLRVAYTANALCHNCTALTAKLLTGSTTVAICTDGAGSTRKDTSGIGVGIADALTSSLAALSMEVTGGGRTTGANTQTILPEIASSATTRATYTTTVSIT